MDGPSAPPEGLADLPQPLLDPILYGQFSEFQIFAHNKEG